MSDLDTTTAGAGDPALLFLHGWCGDRSFFAPQFEHFAATDRVVSVDLPGHGKSAVPSKYEIWSFAAEIADLARGARPRSQRGVRSQHRRDGCARHSRGTSPTSCAAW